MAVYKSYQVLDVRDKRKSVMCILISKYIHHYLSNVSAAERTNVIGESVANLCNECQTILINRIIRKQERLEESIRKYINAVIVY